MNSATRSSSTSEEAPPSSTIEYYEHGQLVAYPGGKMPDEQEGEAADLFFSIIDWTPASSRAAFEEQGWLGPR